MKKTPCRRESAASGTLMTLQEVADYPRVTRATIHRMLKRHHWRTVDSSQIMMPLGWGPAAHPLPDDAPPYDGSLAP